MRPKLNLKTENQWSQRAREGKEGHESPILHMRKLVAVLEPYQIEQDIYSSMSRTEMNEELRILKEIEELTLSLPSFKRCQESESQLRSRTRMTNKNDQKTVTLKQKDRCDRKVDQGDER